MNKSIALVLVMGVVYRFIVGLQVIDTVDIGFSHTFYDVIFSAPDSNIFCFIYYLTGLMGGLWEMLLGSLGLVGFRALAAVFIAASLFVLHRLFADKMPDRLLLACMALGFLFPLNVTTFNYVSTTYLFVALSAWFFNVSSRPGRSNWLIACGVMVGLSFFLRIVNMSLIALIPVVFACRYVNKTPREGFNDALRFTCGIVIGVVLVFATMLVLGHHTYFIDALGEGFSTLGRESATHSSNQLVSRYFHGYSNILMQCAALVTMLLAYIKSRSLKSRRWRTVIASLLAVALLVLTYTSNPYLSMLAAGLMVCGFVMVKRKVDGSAMELFAYLIVATLLLPIGSDTGIQATFNNMAGLLLYPAAYCSQYVNWRKPLTALYACVFVAAFVRTASNTYGATLCNLGNVDVPQPGRLNAITDSQNAADLRSAISAVGAHTDRYKQLLVAFPKSRSEIYYATNTQPFLGHVQCEIYENDMLRWRLDERAAHFGCLPMVLLSADAEPKADDPFIHIIVEWMQRNGYRKVSGDSFAELYLPPRGK